MKQYLMIGLSITGLSVLDFFKKTNRLESIIAFDDGLSDEKLGEIKKTYPTVDFYQDVASLPNLDKLQTIIKSPGVPFSANIMQLPELANKPVICDVELLLGQLEPSQKVIAITGTNGKSTVTTLVGELLKALDFKVFIGGNIGVPVLSQNVKDFDYFVLELSSFQLETIHSLKAYSATCLNISEDHLDRYQSFQDYAAVKQKIYENAKNAIFNLDNKLTKPIDKKATQCFSFSLESPSADAYLLEDKLILRQQDGHTLLIKESEVALTGRQNMANILAALLLLSPLNLPAKKLKLALSQISGLKHRCQYIKTIHGVDFINDSKGTNVGATISAINGLKKPQKKLVLIAGGQAKGAKLSPLYEIAKSHLSGVVLIGEDQNAFYQALDGACPIEKANDLESAVIKAKDMAFNNGMVLLSPAAASFDMFKNFAHRGDCFIQIVEGLS